VLVSGCKPGPKYYLAPTFNEYLQGWKLRALHSMALLLGQFENWDCEFESSPRHGYLSTFLYVMVACVGRGLEIGRSTVQRVLQKYLNKFIVSEVNSGSKRVRRLSPWNNEVSFCHLPV